jgi:hypothetical protein
LNEFRQVPSPTPLLSYNLTSEDGLGLSFTFVILLCLLDNKNNSLILFSSEDVAETTSIRWNLIFS